MGSVNSNVWVKANLNRRLDRAGRMVKDMTTRLGSFTFDVPRMSFEEASQKANIMLVMAQEFHNEILEITKLTDADKWGDANSVDAAGDDDGFIDAKASNVKWEDIFGRNERDPNFVQPDKEHKVYAEVKKQQEAREERDRRPNPNDQQAFAIKTITEWSESEYVDSDGPDASANYMSLEGGPGTGKTFSMCEVNRKVDGLIPSAPTHKSARALSESLGIKANTVYSVLGVRLKEVEDRVEIVYSDDAPYIKKGSVLQVDEASMLNTQMLSHIEKIRAQLKLRILFVGDSYQLPPVGEDKPYAFKIPPKAHRLKLTKVERFDDQILKATKRIRKNIRRGIKRSPLKNDYDQDGGTLKGVRLSDSKNDFIEKILKLRHPDEFQEIKVVCWRNKAVNGYNKLIRENFGFTKKFVVGDRLLIHEPIMGEYGDIIANTDDPVLVLEVRRTKRKVEGITLDVHYLTVETMDGDQLSISVPVFPSARDGFLHPLREAAYHAKSGRNRKMAWEKYWKVYRAFPLVRYDYALTSHRIQGSTVNRVFVDQRDILANPNPRECMSSLLVGTSRARFLVDSF